MCYLKGTCPLAHLTAKQLERLTAAQDDPDLMKELAEEIGEEALFQELPMEEFYERLRTAVVEDGNTRLEAVINLGKVSFIRCRCIDIYEGMFRWSRPALITLFR